jgi:hypothetical protein
MKFFEFKEFKLGKPGQPGSIAWILVDVPDEIDLNSPRFRVRVGGAKIPGVDGTPDPDAFGVLRHPPQ